MRRINSEKDQLRALELMVKCFSNMPGMTWMLRGKGSNVKRVTKLMQFILNEAMLLEGAYISDNSNGIIFMFHSSLRCRSRVSILQKMNLCFGVMAIKNAFRISKIQKRINELRPQDGLYVWILASDPDENGHASGYEIKKWLIDRSIQSGLPVYVEATEPRNKRLYAYLGFEEYATVPNTYAGVTISLMKRKVK